MALKLYISALIFASLTEMAAAQNAPIVKHAELTQAGLTACQSLHHITIILSDLHNSPISASRALDEVEVAKLSRHIQKLERITKTSYYADSNLNTEMLVLSKIKVNLDAHLETSPSMRTPLENVVPPNFTKVLRSVSTGLNCEQYMFDTLIPIQTDSKGKPSFKGANRTNSEFLDNAASASQNPTYHHIENQTLISDASARHLARNPMKFPFDGNSRYLFPLTLITFVCVIIYMYRRFKKFEAREPRKILNHLIKVKIKDEIYNFHLVDLSRNGAKLNHLKSIKSKSNVHLELGNSWYLGQIKWHNNLFAGVKFKAPLDVPTFDEIVNTS